MEPARKSKWADAAAGPDAPAKDAPKAPEHGGEDYKVVVEFTTNEKGQKVKLTKRFKVAKKEVKVNKSVEARRRWKKFGECAGLPPGPEKVITTVAEELFFDYPKSKQQDKDAVLKEGGSKDAVLSSIVCRNCGKLGHWTLKCPLKGSLAPAGFDSPDARSETLAPAGPGKYKPPGMRSGPGGAPGAPSGDSMYDRRRDEPTLRVTNLSEDTREPDLSELFRPFGPISRIYLAKDKHSGLSKGFAFINFVHREDAARALEKLQGHGYDHLILHLEWAKPSPAP